MHVLYLYMLSCFDENLYKCVVVIVLGFVVYNVLKDNLKLFIYETTRNI